MVAIVLKVETHIRPETGSLDDLFERLQGRVFHVTKAVYLPSILTDGAIRPNQDATLTTTFGTSANSFFRKRNCVSLFDYRAATPMQIQDSYLKCSPFQPAHPGAGGLAILFLNPLAHQALIPWTRCADEHAQSEMIVPHVEAGYPGPIPISMIEEQINLELLEDPKSLSAMYR